MARHRSYNRSIPALPRPIRYSRTTYRQPYRQSRPVAQQRAVRLRQRRTRQHSRRSRIDNTQRARLCPHLEQGVPGAFWWRLH